MKPAIQNPLIDADSMPDMLDSVADTLAFLQKVVAEQESLHGDSINNCEWLVQHTCVETLRYELARMIESDVQEYQRAVGAAGFKL
jgi:hypothetical protein